jgi:NCS2 family nucleobase:cation symporter-2
MKKPANLIYGSDDEPLHYEFDIDVKLAYDGTMLETPGHAPSEQEIIESEEGHRKLAGFMVSRQSDRVVSTTHQGLTVLKLHFRH